jgi:hypothetical protein
MGKPGKPPPVKLVIGCIFQDKIIYQKARTLLAKKFGAIDFESAALDFVHTDYYEKEFGTGLFKQFISFKKLILPERLAPIKLYTNGLESRLSLHGRRGINLDPGYLSLAKYCLATTKDYRHRIYLGRGIFAEMTLYYQGKSFAAWEWTYPDYRTPEYIRILNQIRDIYAAQIKEI